MKIGFTGSRLGASLDQEIVLGRVTDYLKSCDDFVFTFLHGDCIGVDEAVHKVGVASGHNVEVYPPTNSRFRAYCHLRTHPIRKEQVVVHVKSPYLVRNRKIVRNSSVVIGLPSSEEPRNEGGTWYTLKYSDDSKVSNFQILPSGKVVGRPYFIEETNEARIFLGLVSAIGKEHFRSTT